MRRAFGLSLALFFATARAFAGQPGGDVPRVDANEAEPAPSGAEPAPSGAEPAPSGAEPAPSAPPAAAPVPASSAAPTPSTPPPASAAPAKKRPRGMTGDLQSPENVSTRNSAYSLPRGVWAFDLGALGIGGGDVFANLGAGYGLGARLQLEINLAHLGVGLANITTGWQIVDTRYFDLGARLGIWYGRGQWFWIAPAATKRLVSKIDMLNVPIEVTASSQVARWLELDLGLHYGYAKIFGSSDDPNSLFAKAELGLTQFYVSPGARFFLSDRTSLEVSVKLPLYSAIPLDHGTISVPFKDTWALETGVRSRLTRVFFGNIRLHYGAIADALYGARLYPSFDLEVRF
jgi:hypothetical protein